MNYILINGINTGDYYLLDRINLKIIELKKNYLQDFKEFNFKYEEITKDIFRYLNKSGTFGNEILKKFINPKYESYDTRFYNTIEEIEEQLKISYTTILYYLNQKNNSKYIKLINENCGKAIPKNN